jgi:DNA-binding FadR family transcriptional regulator
MTLSPATRKLYQQVASTIMAAITSGKYKPGERLPSEHDPKAARNTMRDHLARVIEDLLAATEPDALDGTSPRSVKKRSDHVRRLAI